MNSSADVIVVGGGPSGASTAMFLGRQGIDTLLIEKKDFPRDKPCGDAISERSLKTINQMGLLDKLQEQPKHEVNSAYITAPNRAGINIDLQRIEHETPDGEIIETPRCYSCRRYVFDDMLFNQACEHGSVEVMQETKVKELIRDESGAVSGVVAKNDNGTHELRSRVVVGADSAASTVAREVGSYHMNAKHTIIAARTYYRDVANVSDRFEFHFVDDIIVDGRIAGYFWIIPSDDGRANVGVGMRKTEEQIVDESSIGAMLERIIDGHADLRERFEGAQEVEDAYQQWAFSFGSDPRDMVGNGWVLVGDAAGLAGPVTGGGIQHAMISGRHAANQIGRHFENDEGLEPYREALWDEIGDYINTAYGMQQRGYGAGLQKLGVNIIIDQAERKPAVKQLLQDRLVDRDRWSEFNGPLFFLRLLYRMLRTSPYFWAAIVFLCVLVGYLIL